MKLFRKIFTSFILICFCNILTIAQTLADDGIKTAEDFVKSKDKNYKVDHKQKLANGSYLIGYKSGQHYYVEQVTPVKTIVGRDKDGNDITEIGYKNSKFDVNQYGNRDVKNWQEFENLCKDGKNANGQMCKVTLLRGDSGGKSLGSTTGDSTTTVAEKGLNQGYKPVNKKVAMQDVSGCSANYGLFSGLIAAGNKIFTGLRELIYVVAGFGIIGVSVGGFFGNPNYKWLGAIVISLVIIATTGELINAITGCETFTKNVITDTLK